MQEQLYFIPSLMVRESGPSALLYPQIPGHFTSCALDTADHPDYQNTVLNVRSWDQC